MNEALAAIVRPIVEGQVRAWQRAHPNGEAHPGHLVSGIGKRVTHDLCSAQTVERIRLALGAGCGGDAVREEAAGGSYLPPRGGLEATTGRPGAGGELSASPACRAGAATEQGGPAHA